MPSEPSDGIRRTTASDHPELPFVGTIVSEKYRIDAVLGAGGMGVVFAATHLLTGRHLALKWLLPELSADHDAVERFMREAQFAGGIDHPNVIAILDVGFHAASAFIVMEHLVGESLSRLLERETRLAVPDALSILIPAMRGVAAAHARNVLHRDLKPDNIFVCRNADGSISNVKVLDFGISKMISTNAADPALTQSGVLLGTPDYMPLEQFRAERDLDERVDVYAFGVILYEVLTGKVPFDALTYSALLLAVSTSTPQRPRTLCKGISRRLERVIMKAMARDRDDRHATLAELIAALTPFVGAGARLDARATSAGARRSTAAGLWTLSGVLVLGSLTVWLSRERTHAPQPLESTPARRVATTATPALVRQLPAAIDAGMPGRSADDHGMAEHAATPPRGHAQPPAPDPVQRRRTLAPHTSPAPAPLKIPLAPIAPQYVPSPLRSGPLGADDF